MVIQTVPLRDQPVLIAPPDYFAPQNLQEAREYVRSTYPNAGRLRQIDVSSVIEQIRQEYQNPMVDEIFRRYPPIVFAVNNMRDLEHTSDGFYETGTNICVVSSTSQTLLVHEILHYLGSFGKLATRLEGGAQYYSNRRLVRREESQVSNLHEGVTEYLATCITLSPDRSPSYPYQTANALIFANITSQTELSEAYLSGSYVQIQQRVDRVLGDGTFERVVEAATTAEGFLFLVTKLRETGNDSILRSLFLDPVSYGLDPMLLIRPHIGQVHVLDSHGQPTQIQLPIWFELGAYGLGRSFGRSFGDDSAAQLYNGDMILRALWRFVDSSALIRPLVLSPQDHANLIPVQQRIDANCGEGAFLRILHSTTFEEAVAIVRSGIESTEYQRFSMHSFDYGQTSQNRVNRCPVWLYNSLFEASVVRNGLPEFNRNDVDLFYTTQHNNLFERFVGLITRITPDQISVAIQTGDFNPIRELIDQRYGMGTFENMIRSSFDANDATDYLLELEAERRTPSSVRVHGQTVQLPQWMQIELGRSQISLGSGDFDRFVYGTTTTLASLVPDRQTVREALESGDFTQIAEQIDQECGVGTFTALLSSTSADQARERTARQYLDFTLRHSRRTD